jgi:hypothetical protein
LFREIEDAAEFSSPSLRIECRIDQCAHLESKIKITWL